MDAKQKRGLLIATTCKIERNKLGWKVPSQSGNGSYIVSLDRGEPFCTCADFEAQHQKCKHIFAVEFFLQEGGYLILVFRSNLGILEASHLQIFVVAPISSGLVIIALTRLTKTKRCLMAFTIQDNDLEQLISQA